MDPPTAETLESVPRLLAWILGTAFVVIGGLFRMLWAKATAAETRLQGQLAECEAKHTRSDEKVLDLTRQVATIDGRLEQLKVDRQEMKGLHEEVLREVRKANESRPINS